MSRLVKDYVEIGDFAALDTLIARLSELRESLPEGAEAEVRLRGDDVFGRHLSIAFLRPQTAEEAECEARYAQAYEESLQRDGARVQADPRKRRGLRAVA